MQMTQLSSLIKEIQQSYLSEIDTLDLNVTKSDFFSFLSRLQKKGVHTYTDLKQRLSKDHFDYIKLTLDTMNVHLDLALGVNLQEAFLLICSDNKVIPRNDLRELSIAGGLYNYLIRLVDRVLDTKDTTKQFLEIMNAKTLASFKENQNANSIAPLPPVSSIQSSEPIRKMCELIHWYLQRCHQYFRYPGVWQDYIDDLIALYKAEVTCAVADILTTPINVLKEALIMKSGLSPYLYVGLSTYTHFDYSRLDITSLLEAVRHLNFFIRLTDDLADFKKDWLAGKINYLIIDTIQQIDGDFKSFINSEEKDREKSLQQIFTFVLEEKLHLGTLSKMYECYQKAFRILGNTFSSSSTHRLQQFFQYLFFHPIPTI